MNDQPAPSSALAGTEPSLSSGFSWCWLGFPLLVLLSVGLAWAWPEVWTPYKGLIGPLLMVIMVSMGLTLTWADFLRIRHMPWAIVLGLIAQYGGMAALAAGVAWMVQLPTPWAVGLILVGCCPGGTASNVMAYLARGDVALSITLTAISTLLAAVLTPLVFYLWASGRESQWLELDVMGLMWSTATLVVIPVVVGVLLGHGLAPWRSVWEPVVPKVAMGGIILIIAIIVALNVNALTLGVLVLLLAVVLHNGLGYGVGYGVGRLSRQAELVNRTLAMEVGIQNSGLAMALAMAHFGPEYAVPAALFSVVQNVTGPVLAQGLSGMTHPK